MGRSGFGPGAPGPVPPRSSDRALQILQFVNLTLFGTCSIFDSLAQGRNRLGDSGD